MIRELDLLRARAAHGTAKTKVSVDDLCKKLPDVPRSTLANYLSGKHFPPADVLDQIVIALGTSPSEQRDWSSAWFKAHEHRATRRSVLDGHANPVATPRELPLNVDNFTGRRQHLRALDSLLAAGAAVIAISGAAGVGKTALAVHWAHTVRRRFPDGQLHIDLRGYDPNDPVPPTDALATLLGSLGVRPDEIPPEEAQRAARYRTLLADRRIFVLLDNAHSAQHVRPLLPGSPSCLAIVTSRASLPGLVAGQGAKRVNLDPMPQDEAISLLRSLIGARVDAEPAAAVALADRCARLPLALRILAERVDTNPDATLAEVAAEFEPGRALDQFDGEEDPRTDIRSVFSWSLDRLRPEAAGAYQSLGLHPGHDFDAYAVAALADADLTHARRLTVALHRAHLLEPRSGRDRYGMHDLLRAYAGERAARIPEPDALAAMGRLSDYYRHTASKAVDAIQVGEEDFRPVAQPITTPSPEFGGAADAIAWLSAERSNLVQVALYSVQHENHGHAIEFVLTLNRYVHNGGFQAEALSILGPALRAAREQHDVRGEAFALNTIGIAHVRLGDYGTAEGHFDQALAVCRAARRKLAATNDTVLADASYYRADTPEPARISREIAFGFGEAVALSNLGIVNTRLGRYPEALAYHQEALALLRQTGLRAIEGSVLVGLGEVHLKQARYPEAIDYCNRALSLARENGQRASEGAALARLGDTFRMEGRYDDALGRYRAAHALARRTEDPGLEAEALNGLGSTWRAMDEHRKALNCHTEALTVARSAGLRHHWGHALAGTALAQRSLGLHAPAGRHLEQALAIYADLAVPDADDLRAHLDTR